MIILTVVDKTENFLNDISPIPVIGRAAGFVRACLGLVQTITALALAILLAIPAMAIPGVRPVFSKCITHTGHGLKNIVGGTLEMIPFIGVMF